MRPALEPRVSGSLLTVQGTGVAWSIAAGAVTSVTRAGDWSGQPGLDVAGLLGGADGQELEAAIIEVQAEGVRLPLLARGTLRLLQVPEAQQLLLPLPLQNCSPLIERIALIDGVPALLVLSARRMLEAFGTHDSAPVGSAPSCSR